MPSVPLHTKAIVHRSDDVVSNTLPNLLQTPSGLAILELQGTIHAPFPQPEDQTTAFDQSHLSVVHTPIGRLEFPLFDPAADASDVKWMKRVYLYVGKHQRLTGEVKKLSKALVVVGKRIDAALSDQPSEELEILEVIRYKILFGGRPEPVGD